MLVHLHHLINMFIPLFQQPLMQSKQSVVVDMLELQQLSSKITKDHYLLLVSFLIERLKFRQVRALFHILIKVVVTHMNSIMIYHLDLDIVVDQLRLV